MGTGGVQRPVVLEEEVVGLKATGGELEEWKTEEKGHVLCEGAEGRKSI